MLSDGKEVSIDSISSKGLLHRPDDHILNANCSGNSTTRLAMLREGVDLPGITSHASKLATTSDVDKADPESILWPQSIDLTQEHLEQV